MQNSSLFHALPLRTRQCLFWGICIWVRLILASAAISALNKWPVWGNATAFVLAALAWQLNGNKSPVWWSRKGHRLTAAAVGIVTLQNLFAQSRKPGGLAVGVLLAIDTVLGAASAMSNQV